MAIAHSGSAAHLAATQAAASEATVEQATHQMISAAFLEQGVPTDSTAYVAVQFRVTAASPFQLGHPSTGSSWLVVKGTKFNVH